MSCTHLGYSLIFDRSGGAGEVGGSVGRSEPLDNSERASTTPRGVFWNDVE